MICKTLSERCTCEFSSVLRGRHLNIDSQIGSSFNLICDFWRKGDTSGHVQYVKSLALDCDGDAILVQVDQVGAACHTGKRSCFEEGGPLPVVVGNRTAEQENA